MKNNRFSISCPRKIEGKFSEERKTKRLPQDITFALYSIFPQSEKYFKNSARATVCESYIYFSWCIGTRCTLGGHF